MLSQKDGKTEEHARSMPAYLLVMSFMPFFPSTLIGYERFDYPILACYKKIKSD